MTEDKLYQDLKIEISDLKTVLLIGVYFGAKGKPICEEHLLELQALASTYGFETLERVSVPLKKYDSGTYIGKGKIQELSTDCQADIIIFDDEISPGQQRNLEEAFGKPVIDRTELILEVFSQRAQSSEACLQIDLAKIKYQMPRLKRLWTHLSRQRSSGKGFLKGEGEKQIEIDRRLLRKQVTKLEGELKQVSAQRHTQRSARMRSNVPTFAIVGYTNVGKSTLLNALTGAGVLEEDKLFATLDTTARQYNLPNHQKIVLIDTVGFIRKLPHTLVAAFKSTLEEACYTDILLHLIDVSHPAAIEQAESTFEVLKELGAEDKPIITVLNKVDLLEQPHLVIKFRTLYPNVVAISAKKREGFDDLLTKIEELLASLRKVVSLRIPQSHYELVSELRKKSRIIALDYEGNDILIEAEIPSVLEHKIEKFKIY